MKTLPLKLSICLTVAALGACGPGRTTPDPVVEDPPPAVTTDEAAPTVRLLVGDFMNVKGSILFDVAAADDVGLAKLELLVAGITTPVASTSAAPFNSLTWDSTNTPDGLQSVVVRATDTAAKTTDSAPVRVVVLNHGVQAADLGAVSDSMLIPVSLAGELDHKHHWNNPANIHTIVAVLEFAVPAGQVEWNVGLSVGKGECPDNGETIGTETIAATSPIVVTAHPTAAQLATGLHFVHLRPINAAQHKGEALPHSVRVFLFE
ncbi:MAG: hypothetical protein ACYC8T_20330 [Myxococcaceae bacterium]